MPLLTVTDLRTHFHTRNGVYRAVDGVSFSVERGETLGHRGRVRLGQVGHLLLDHGPDPPAPGQDRERLGDVRRRRPPALQPEGGPLDPRQAGPMIFQDPMTSLNPYLRVSEQLIEPLLIHEKISQEGGPGPRARDDGGRRDQRRGGGSTSIPTSSRAACASG
jgi:oligopeptide transport system ATP-binding protein